MLGSNEATLPKSSSFLLDILHPYGEAKIPSGGVLGFEGKGQPWHLLSELLKKLVLLVGGAEDDLEALVLVGTQGSQGSFRLPGSIFTVHPMKGRA